MTVSPTDIRVGDMIQDPSFPAHEAPWVEVRHLYRPDYRDGFRCLEVQDHRGNEYTVYVSLAYKIAVNR